MSSDRETIWLQDVIRNIQLAEQFIGEMTSQQFEENVEALYATERCIQIVTEAIIRIGEDRFGNIFQGQSWREVKGMGNRLRHDYAGIDPLIVFETVKRDFPALKEACEAELSR